MEKTYSIEEDKLVETTPVIQTFSYEELKSKKSQLEQEKINMQTYCDTEIAKIDTKLEDINLRISKFEELKPEVKEGVVEEKVEEESNNQII